VADVGVQAEPAGAGRPQLSPVALRRPGHLDPRTLVPPGSAPPCTGPEVAERSSNHGSREPIWSSSRIPIGFIMTIRRLTRMSWPCRSRYATSATRSQATARRSHPGGARPAGRRRPSAPQSQCRPGQDRRPNQRKRPTGGCNRHGEGLNYPSQANRCSQGDKGTLADGRRTWT
jgi:hypothetical protein